MGDHSMDEPSVYCIRIQGHLDAKWSDWFEGLQFSYETNGETALTGPIVDQAALQGVLMKISNLGLSLISVNRVEPESKA